jgi:hypothetical protein
MPLLLQLSIVKFGMFYGCCSSSFCLTRPAADSCMQGSLCYVPTYMRPFWHRLLLRTIPLVGRCTQGLAPLLRSPFVMAGCRTQPFWRIMTAPECMRKVVKQPVTCLVGDCALIGDARPACATHQLPSHLGHDRPVSNAGNTYPYPPILVALPGWLLSTRHRPWWHMHAPREDSGQHLCTCLAAPQEPFGCWS